MTRRHCAWFGCSAVATATYTFDADACTVWLDTPFEGGARAGDLCDRHSRSLKPPRGWRLEDRRARAEAVVPHDPEPEPPAPVERERFESEELRALLDAHSPLLARAFRSAGSV